MPFQPPTRKQPRVDDDRVGLVEPTVSVSVSREVAVVRPAPRPERVPHQIGPYRPVRILGRGGMGVVYEAVHGATGARVALKMAGGDGEQSPSRLRAEIHALECVSHPGIVRLIDHGIDDGVHFYAMDLLEGHTWQDYTEVLWSSWREGGRTARPPAANGKLREVLRHARALAEALDHLHGLGLVHCDVSPRNVFVRDDGSTVLMDLGLVSRHRGAVGPDVLEPANTPAGTLGYMAPEQILGLSVDARADLYSLGAMIHTAVTGRASASGALVRMSTLVKDVPADLDSLVEQLLTPSRSERPLTATDVVQVLNALDGGGAVPRLAASARLFRSPVFGRDDVLQSLSRAVGRAESRGSFTLIAGESGIGKTALAAMVARIAAMNGLRVITGECVPLVPTGGHHHPGLRGPHFSPLRALLNVAIDCSLSRDEPVLTALLQSLAAYEPRAVAATEGATEPSPVPLGGEGAKSRLCEDVAALLAELARPKPILLVLDDLHCADELTMTFLASLSFDYFERHRVVLVATYRTEQSDELVRLLSARPYVETVFLDPLSEPDVREMIAESSGFRVPEPWVRVLHEKSRGNPFLVAEYLRTALDEGMLVRDNGNPAAIAAAESFARMAGSIEDLIRRRLARLSRRATLLVQLAAVIGNPVPRSLLAETSGLSPEDVRQEVEELVRRNLLEGIDPQHHRFMHDRLREVAYESIDDNLRAKLHRQVGRAIEARLDRAAAQAAAASVLAHHFVRGADEEKAVDYLALAADVAHRAFANREVVALLTEALSLTGRARDPEPARVARFHFRLGNAYFGLGMLEESRAHLVRMLELLDLRLPAGGATGWRRCVVEMGRQIVHRLFGPASSEASRRPLLLEAVSAHDLLMQVYFYQGDNVPGMLHCALAGLNLAETLGPSPELRLALANAQSTAAMLGLRHVAHAYEALGAAVTFDEDDVGLSTSAAVRQCAQHVIWAEWQAAEGCVTRIIRDAGAVTHRRREEEGISLLAFMRFAQGRFGECRALYNDLRLSASRGDPQSLSWSMVFRAHVDLVHDRTRSAIEIATEGLELVKFLPGRSEAINLHSAMALGFLRLEDTARAELHARKALALGRSADLVVFLDIVAYAYLAEVCQGLTVAATRGSANEVRRLAGDASRQLDRCARLFPIAVPRVALWRGIGHWHAGRRARARTAWTKALSTARALGMPHEQAHAELLLDLHGASPVPHDDALARAQGAFRKLGAAFDERKVSEARALGAAGTPAAPSERIVGSTEAVRGRRVEPFGGS